MSGAGVNFTLEDKRNSVWFFFFCKVFPENKEVNWQMLEIPLKICGCKFKVRAFCMILGLAAPGAEKMENWT